MKSTLSRQQFFALIHYELQGNARHVFWFSALMLFTMFIPLLFSSGIGTPTLHDFPILPGTSFFLWFYPVMVGMNIFAFSSAASPGRGLDFGFTRAIPRAAWFRAKTVIYFSCIIAPLLIYQGWSFFQPDLELRRHHDLPSGTRQERYLQIFPRSYEEKSAEPYSVGKICIPHGHALLAGFEFWVALLHAVLFQAFVLWLLSRQSKNERIPAVTFLFFFPVICMIGWQLIQVYDPQDERLNRGFVFFCQHWLVLFAGLMGLIWLMEKHGGRRFAELEIH